MERELLLVDVGVRREARNHWGKEWWRVTTTRQRKRSGGIEQSERVKSNG